MELQPSCAGPAGGTIIASRRIVALDLSDYLRMSIRCIATRPTLEQNWRSSIALPRTRSAPFRRSNATDCGSRQRWRQGSAPAHARSCRPLRCVRDTHDARCTTTGAPSRRNNRGGLRCPQATPFWPEPRWRRGTASLRASGIYLTRTLSRLLVAAQITRIPARTPRMASFARDHRAASMGPASS